MKEGGIMMETPFQVRISKDHLAAEIDLNGEIKDNDSISIRGLEALLKENNILFGIDQEILKKIVENLRDIQFPIIVAKGNPPQHGEDAYLIVEYQQKETNKKERVNFRNILDIPSVKNGQLIARSVPQTVGKSGRTVTGKLLPARDGKPLMIRAGKNVIKDGNQFISTIDGQVSITHKMIAVNPVFEVNGDLDLKTGNVNFIGNVIIRGDVPTGYEVIAGGDIKIYGLVEGAQLVAKGNIMITGGITGGNRGRIVANGSIQANFLNQADVRAGQDIIINSSSLHSKIEAGGSILCNNGTIIGGVLLAGKDIHVKELGNHLYTKTDLTVGYDPSIELKEKKLVEEAEEISENVKKLDKIENIMIQASKAKGQITEQEKELIIKQRTTKNQLLSQLSDIQKQIKFIDEEKENRGKHCIFVYDKVHPNSSLHFGKYTKLIQTAHSYVKFYVNNSEIVFEPIG